MRLGILTAALGGGGAEQQAAIWSRLCLQQGHTVAAVVLWQPPSAVDIPGIRLLRVPKTSPAGLVSIVRQIRRLETELDALVAFEPYLAVCCLLARIRIPWLIVTGKVPTLLTEGSRIPMWLYRHAFQHATLASAPNQKMVDAHRALGVRSEGDWVVVPNVADSAAFVPSPPDRGGALFVGRLEPVKNPLLALHSALAARARLTILGDGTLRNTLENAIQESKTPLVEILPFRKDPWPVYAAHRVLVLTSRYESFGNAIIESLAAGTPVVSVDCDFGPREIIGAAHYSHLVEGDIASISAALSTVLARPYTSAEEDECHAIAARYHPDRVSPLIADTLGRLASEPAAI